MEKIGLFYGSNTMKTAEIAEQIKKEFKNVEIELVSVEKAWKEDFDSFQNIILGASTWFDGELPNYWEEILPELKNIDLKGKKVAIFGLGDQQNYSDNFADGVGILADIIKKSGATLIGSTSTKGYTFNSSKAQSGDQFCGLVLDIENQSDLTAKRISTWVQALKKEFGLVK